MRIVVILIFFRGRRKVLEGGGRVVEVGGVGEVEGRSEVKV